MRCVRMLVSAAGTELSLLQQHSSLATELRNLGLDDSKLPLLYSPHRPYLAQLRVFSSSWW